MASDMKTILKEARKSFKQNDYMDTVKKCKKVLKSEKDNYAALVLLAAAMNEIDEFKNQVHLPLQRAVEIDPENPIGWQGLTSYYEKESKNDEDAIKLLSAYCKVLELHRDNPKYPDIVQKASELCLRIKDTVAIDATILALSTMRGVNDEKKINLLNKMLAWILTSHAVKLDKHNDIRKDVLASVIKDTDVINRQDYYREYIKMLYNSNDLDCLLKTALEMHKLFPEEIFPLEYLCKIYYEQHMLHKRTLDIDISQIYDMLLKLAPDSQSGAMAKALHLQSMNDLIHAREILTELVMQRSDCLYAWLLLSDIYTKLSCWENVESAANQALDYGKEKLPKDILYRIKVLLIDAMSRSDSTQKIENAAAMCEQLLQQSPSIELQIIDTRASVLLNKENACTKLNDLELKPEAKEQASILRALYYKKQNRLEEAALVLDSALEISEAWLMLGEIYWTMAEYNRSLMAFLNGVKADSFNWECLIRLGHYYRQYGNDIERSRRCYQTALQINPNSEQAGIGLSTTYRVLKNQDANIQLLQRLTTQNNGPKWAWLQLGLQYLDQGDAVLAIKAFQHVIRANPNNSHSWESLADAYLVRGAYTAALRSYQRTLELSPGSLYSMIQLANIKLIIGEYNEAKEDFGRILTDKPHYLPALKGFAEVCLCLATENVKNHFYGRARRNLQCAADNLTDAILKDNQISCVWKLFGDVCYRVAQLSNKYCHLDVDPQFLNSQSADKVKTILRLDILLLCQRCYCRALTLHQNSALLWHDLASCYFARLKLDTSLDSKEHVRKCLAIAKHAVKLNPTSWVHWNFLGVMCMSPYVKNYALAQHCFVTAIDKEPNNAVVWSNLATLYLYIGNIYKANEAYSQAQHSDPAFINSWAGQSLIAEKIGRKEAIDLFRHSIQLGYHDQGAIGYAHYVLTMLFDPNSRKDALCTYMMENMHAISVATDELHWYIERHPEESYARNSYGLLLERQKLYRSAVEQFTAGLQSAGSASEKDSMCVNLGRVLIPVGKYTKAIELLRTVKPASFKLNCQLALALFKDERYEESYSMYETALQWLAENDLEKANALCAMAAMAYTFQGIEDAKTLLFQCIQMQERILPALLAAAALGILHGDWNLTTLVLNELKPHETDPEYGSDIVNLLGYFNLIQGNVKNAILSFCSAIHKYPHNTRYWLKLLRVLVEVDHKTFSRCAEKVLILDKNTTCTDTIHLACALSRFQEHDTAIENLKLPQKIVFTYPYSAKTWSVFLASLLSRRTDDLPYPGKQLPNLITVVEKAFCPTKESSQWFSIIRKKINIAADS